MFRKFALTLALGVTVCGGTAALAQDNAAPEQNAQEAAPNAAPAAPLWLVSCSNQMQPEQLQCEFSQSIVVVQGNQSQRVATASFSRAAGHPETTALFTLPHGVSLANPVRILVNDKEVGVLAWQTCDAGGCYASAAVDASWLQAMRAGNTLVAALKARDGGDLNFSFQLSGFTKTEAMLP